MFCLSSMLEINLDKMTGIKKRSEVAVSAAGPGCIWVFLLVCWVIVCFIWSVFAAHCCEGACWGWCWGWASAIAHLLICSIALIKLNRCLSSGRQGGITEFFFYKLSRHSEAYVLKVYSVSLIWDMRNRNNLCTMLKPDPCQQRACESPSRRF